MPKKGYIKGNQLLIIAKSFSLFLFLLPLAVSNQVARKQIPALLEIPALNPGEKITSHFAFTLLYDHNHRQAKWVAYELTKNETESKFERSDKFTADPLIEYNTSFGKDYQKSGYDRGHLAPAADMSWCETAIKESFYYSNMSPQIPSFNRGIWKKLETLVRDWAIVNEKIYIVTGPVLKSGLPQVGPHKITVPEYYYKVIIDYTEPDIKGIGFVLPNEGSGQELMLYTVSIDSVECLTGIDFFPLLPDTVESYLEKQNDYNNWVKPIL